MSAFSTVRNVELECALLDFTVMYKRNVLSSYATSLLGRKLIALNEDEGGASCATDSVAKGDF